MAPREKDHHSTDKFGYRTVEEKKGGAGSYAWGKADDQETCPAALDKKDPNYDSQEEAKKAAQK